jgi:hypothetical protein
MSRALKLLAIGTVARLPKWVKNAPDALEIGCLCCPRKQTSFSCAADCGAIVCYGGAKLADKHLAGNRALTNRGLDFA